MCLSWSPEDPTLLVSACSDDKYPYINLWDLRKATAPVSVLSGIHRQGITDVSWSIHDPGLILSASKDNKLVCWNVRTVILL